MGLKEAQSYIKQLHKLQRDPEKWPDFLTGLPDRGAAARKVCEIYPRLGRYAIALVRIANIHTYLLKYGASRHAEIIQWAAAILKTTAAGCKDSFVGTAGTHEFVVIGRTEELGQILERSRDLFARKMQGFYEKQALRENYLLSFERNGRTVHIGFMELVYATIDHKGDLDEGSIVPFLTQRCSQLESERMTTCEPV